MSSSISIRICETEEQILQAFPVMKQLRPQLVEPNFVQAIRQQEKESYRLVGLVVVANDASVTVAVAGVRIMTNLAFGKILYVDDLVVDEHQRSKGYGSKLFQWLLEYAKANGCGRLHLDSGVQRHGAHRFYLSDPQKMIIACHHFCREV